jgi:hypothetical protein
VLEEPARDELAADRRLRPRARLGLTSAPIGSRVRLERRVETGRGR